MDYEHMLHNKAKKKVRKENENFEKTEPKRIAALSNKELYESTLSWAGGDDYDGGFTYKGQLTFDYHKAELERRLKDWLA
jgi:hypothetical protein